MKYTFTCPIEGCPYTQTVEASDKDDAEEKLFEGAKEHAKNVHPERDMSDEEVEEIVENNTREE